MSAEANQIAFHRNKTVELQPNNSKLPRPSNLPNIHGVPVKNDNFVIEEESKEENSGIKYDEVEEELKREKCDKNEEQDVVRCFTNFYKKPGI